MNGRGRLRIPSGCSLAASEGGLAKGLTKTWAPGLGRRLLPCRGRERTRTPCRTRQITRGEREMERQGVSPDSRTREIPQFSRREAMTTTTTSRTREFLSVVSSRAWVGAGRSAALARPNLSTTVWVVDGGGCFDVSATKGRDGHGRD